MDGLLLFAHGARDPARALPFEAVAERLRQSRPETPLVLAVLSQPSTSTITVDYFANGVTATAGSDFTLAPGTLTFTGCSEYIARQGRPSGGEWLGIPNFADTEGLHFSPSVPAEEIAAAGMEPVSELDLLLAESDVVSLHCPYSPETHHPISTEQLKKMNAATSSPGGGGK